MRNSRHGIPRIHAGEDVKVNLPHMNTHVRPTISGSTLHGPPFQVSAPFSTCDFLPVLRLRRRSLPIYLCQVRLQFRAAQPELAERRHSCNKQNAKSNLAMRCSPAYPLYVRCLWSSCL
jgi:hypothetical protein